MPNPPTEAKAITTAEAAQALGVSVKTVTRYVAAERLVPIRRMPGPRGAMLFDAQDVARLLGASV